MKLGAVVSAVNLNPHYMSFVPQFIRAWTSLFPTVQLHIVLVADEIPKELLPYSSYLHLFPIPPTVSSVLASQCVRLLYPRFVETSDAVLITDIDMLPLQRDYYVNPIRDIPQDTVVVYRHGLPEELYMCYVAAVPTVWCGMFGEEPALDIITRWHDEANVWNKDQTELTKAFNAWSGPKKLYTDREIGFRRLCRSFLECPITSPERQILQNRDKLQFLIQSGHFTDYHAISNSTHSDLNEFIVDSLDGLIDRSPFIPNGTYVSYLPLLFESIVNLPNVPIIECGMGYGSTELLHSLKNHVVVSYDTNLEWFEKFEISNKYLIDPDTWVSCINMHKSANPIIFIDQAPGESREKCIEELLTEFNGIIVAHDTEPAADHGYRMRQHFHKFKYVVEVKTIGAWATALSNSIDITQWVGLTFGDYTITSFIRPEKIVQPILQTANVSDSGKFKRTIIDKLHVI